ncbi:unnamed protein product [Cladocopium goreaui]|uniref:30S ribosomal protein S1-like n=1 Tax=Cladocopium goreaui TaxID=2562237 RepID=A0A9P1DBY0_9DINO|nr:unnamed protein product [Cladocopium goreaui]
MLHQSIERPLPLQVLWPVPSFVRLDAHRSGRRGRRGRSAQRSGMAGLADGSPIFSEEAWSDDMPSELKVQDLEEGQELSGIVVRVVEELGCFVDVGADKQGLVHATQVARGYTPILSEVVQPGQMVQVWVKTVSPEGRLDLTMVDESQDENMAPFKEVDKDLWLDGLHNGGAFAMVQGPNGEGPVEAHIPISQIQDGFLEHPADVLEPGQSVRVRVVKVEGARLSVSMRKLSARLRAEDQDVSSLLEVSPSEWFTGRVDHAAPFGVFVEMDVPDEDSKVVGLVHISEMREGRVGDPAAEVEEGQEVKVRILAVDKNTGRISMSMKPIPTI